MTLHAEPDAPQMRLPAVDDPDVLSQAHITHLEAALAAAEIKIAHLERALVTNRTTSAAVGFLMATHRLSYEQTFAMLREISQTTNHKLFDIAEAVLAAGDLAPAIIEDYAHISQRRVERVAEEIDDGLDTRTPQPNSRQA